MRNPLTPVDADRPDLEAVIRNGPIFFDFRNTAIDALSVRREATQTADIQDSERFPLTAHSAQRLLRIDQETPTTTVPAADPRQLDADGSQGRW